jgi:hypothetical protein
MVFGADRNPPNYSASPRYSSYEVLALLAAAAGKLHVSRLYVTLKRATLEYHTTTKFLVRTSLLRTRCRGTASPNILMSLTLTQLIYHGFSSTLTTSGQSSSRNTRLSSWTCHPQRFAILRPLTLSPSPSKLNPYLHFLLFHAPHAHAALVQFYSRFFHAWATKWCGACMKKAEVKLADYIVKIVWPDQAWVVVSPYFSSELVVFASRNGPDMCCNE